MPMSAAVMLWGFTFLLGGVVVAPEAPSCSAPWGLGVPASAVGGPGSQLWRDAVREPGGGSRGWPDPPSWSCSVCLASSRGARSACRTSRGGRRIPGARSPPNLSSRDRIRCLHGRIRFSLTGSSRFEGGSIIPSLVRRGVHGCAAGAPTFSSVTIRRPDRRPGFSTASTTVSMAHGSHNAATTASVRSAW
jgi:hypothetical protein